VYTPIVTLWALLYQVLDPDKSLSNAVKRIIVWVGAAGGECPSPDTGAYSKARQRTIERKRLATSDSRYSGVIREGYCL
jgi:hypothetical protein